MLCYCMACMQVYSLRTDVSLDNKIQRYTILGNELHSIVLSAVAR